MKMDVKSQFLAAVDRLAEIAKARHAISQKQQPLRERLQVIHARHTLEIATAKDAKDKAVYSNEEMRRAALTIRLSEDDKYQALVAELRVLDSEQDDLVVEHNRLVDQKMLLMLELGLMPQGGEEIPNV